MKLKGTRGGLLLILEDGDQLDDIDREFERTETVLGGRILLQLEGKFSWDLIQHIEAKVNEAGGEIVEIRPPSVVMAARGETKIIARTVRSGGRVVSSGSVVVLGDVNSGAEIIANDDIIVVGQLRGLAHAGASGNENAVIWAEKIVSPQLRIGDAVAQQGADTGEQGGPEVALLKGGAITITEWR